MTLPLAQLRKVQAWLDSHRSLVWLVCVMVPIGYLKIRLTQTHTFPDGIDGGFYTDLAQNIRDGLGVVTDVSLYHKGFPYLPHPSSIYPIWPLTYGLVAKVFPIEKVGIWLPAFFYFVSLLTAYKWASSLSPRDLVPGLRGFNAGHVLVCMLGLHYKYFYVTSRPYTESMAFAMLFFAFWRFQQAWKKQSVGAGLEVGFWLGMLFLVRSQFVIVTIAVALAYLWFIMFSKGGRAAMLKLLASTAVGAAVTVAPYVVYLAQSGTDYTLLDVLLFSETPDSSPLSELNPYTKHKSWDHYLKDKYKGVIYAFKWDKLGYRHSYYLFHYSLVIGFFVLLARFRHLFSKDKRRAALAWLRDNQSVYAMFLCAFAIGGLLVVHALHKSDGAWYFHRRHNLTALLAFFFAWLFLIRSKAPLIYLLGLAIYLGSLHAGAVKNYEYTLKVEKRRPRRARPVIVKWIRKERIKQGRYFTVAFTGSAQELVWQTPGVGYHWISKSTTLRDVEIMMRDLGCEYLVSNRAPWKYNRDSKEFDKIFERILAPDAPKWSIYKLRPPETGLKLLARPDIGADFRVVSPSLENEAKYLLKKKAREDRKKSLKR